MNDYECICLVWTHQKTFNHRAMKIGTPRGKVPSLQNGLISMMLTISGFKKKEYISFVFAKLLQFVCEIIT